MNIGIVTFSLHVAGITPLSHLVDILYPSSDNFYLITGKEGAALQGKRKKFYTYAVKYNTGKNVFTRIIKYIYMQFKISYILIKISNNVDLLFFTLAGESLILPIVTARLLRKRVVIVMAASDIQFLKLSNDVFSEPMEILSKINYTLSNRIVLYSERLIKEWNLEKYKDKICIAHEHFLDFDKFKMKKRFGERDNLVGYIGRLSEEKGTLNVVKAIPEISKEKDDLEFLIGGGGQLCDKIKKYLDENNLNDKVNLAGWIPHDKLPDYLNELKLVVLPSYTEGLPNIMLEAMACGTPVLTTPVGAIPDIITDGETGFIMGNNSPACIAENVVRALEHPDMVRIVENAKELVEREFTYEAAVARHREILKELQ